MSHIILLPSNGLRVQPTVPDPLQTGGPDIPVLQAAKNSWRGTEDGTMEDVKMLMWNRC